MISYDIYLSLSDLLSKIISRSIHVAANGIFKYILMIWYLCIVQNFYKIDLHPVVNVHHHTVTDFFFFWELLKPNLSNFHIHNTVLSKITILYVTSLWLFKFTAQSLYFLTPFSVFLM